LPPAASRAVQFPVTPVRVGALGAGAGSAAALATRGAGRGVLGGAVPCTGAFGSNGALPGVTPPGPAPATKGGLPVVPRAGDAPGGAVEIGEVCSGAVAWALPGGGGNCADCTEDTGAGAMGAGAAGWLTGPKSPNRALCAQPATPAHKASMSGRRDLVISQAP
jgi:hypothetical protein